MINRLKDLRKNILNLTQEEFAQAINISRSNLASIEIGRVNITDRVIQDICRAFNVNEVWLRTGEGEPFSTIDENDRYIINLGKLAGVDNEFIKNAVNFIAETEPEKLKVIEDFMRKCLGI